MISLTIREKWLSKMSGQTDRVEAKSPIFDLFSFVVPQP